MGRSTYQKSVEIRDWLVKRGFTNKDDRNRGLWEIAARRRDGWIVALRGPIHTGARQVWFDGFLRGPIADLDAEPLKFERPEDAKKWFLLQLAGRDKEASAVAAEARERYVKARRWEFGRS